MLVLLLSTLSRVYPAPLHLPSFPPAHTRQEERQGVRAKDVYHLHMTSTAATGIRFSLISKCWIRPLASSAVMGEQEVISQICRGAGLRQPNRAPSVCAVCYSAPSRRIRAHGQKLLVSDKIFILNFTLSLSTLICPSEHGRRLLIPPTPHFNPTSGSNHTAPTHNTPFVIWEDPGESGLGLRAAPKPHVPSQSPSSPSRSR